MLSRVANSIYWAGRYLERAENICRFIYVNLHYTLDTEITDYDSWFPLVLATGDNKEFWKKHEVSSEETVMDFLTFDEDNKNSIISCIKFARENARTVRNDLSSVMWEDINQLYWHTIEHSKKKSLLRSREDFYSKFQTIYRQFLGSMHASMTHNEPWHFLRSGIMLERVDKTARILDVRYFFISSEKIDENTIYDSMLWTALLKSVSALDMYRREYSHIDARCVTEFLISNTFFPRSMHYCVLEVKRSLEKITKTHQHEHSLNLLAMVGELLDIVKSQDNITKQEKGVHNFVDSFQSRLNDIDTKIYELFFAIKSKAGSDAMGQIQTQTQSQTQ